MKGRVERPARWAGRACAIALPMVVTTPAPAQTFQRLIGTEAGDQGQWAEDAGDGGFVLAGSSAVVVSDAYLIKIDGNGAVEWERRYGTKAIERLHRVVRAGDGGYVVAGETVSVPPRGIFAAKHDATGTLQWWRAYTGTPSLGRTALAATADGGFVLAGRLADAGAELMPLLSRIDASGNLVWSSIYVDVAYGADTYASFDDVHALSDGFIVTGTIAETQTGEPDVLLVRTDSVGIPQWMYAYDEPDIQFSAPSVEPTGNGDFVVMCAAKAGEQSGAYVFRTDGTGNVIWCRRYVEFTPSYSLEEVQTGELLIAGHAPGFNASMLLTQGDGELLWGRQYEFGSPFNTFGERALPATNGGFLLLGSTQISPDGFDMYVIRTNAIGVSGCHESPFTPPDPACAVVRHDVELQGDSVFSQTDPPIGVAETDTLVEVLCQSGQCPWDLDFDLAVSFDDLLHLLAAWGPCGDPCPEDFDGDGFVGFNDLLDLLSAWGPCE